MSRWFRFYDEVLNDPKVQGLPCELFKGWVNILCAAAKNDGTIPDVSSLAFLLRTTVSSTSKLIEDLIALSLVDVWENGRQTPHNWRRRQYKSDCSTERTRRFRKRSRNGDETPPEQNRTETEKIVEIDPVREAKKGEIEKGFSEFYSAYPKRQAPKKAREAYAKARREVSHEAIMAGLGRAKSSDHRFREIKFTPMPASWLNAGSWADQAPQPTNRDLGILA